MANVSSVSVMVDDTLEDEAWKDSFDKLFEADRPVLRERNIVKEDVRVSFNINSSVENCSRGGDDSSLLIPMPKSLHTVPSIAKNGSSISTPVAKRLAANPFKCSLSPIGAWKLTYFDTAETKNKCVDKMNATEINSDIVGCDYELEENNESHPYKSARSKEELSLLPLSKWFPKSKKQNRKRTHSQRHVCFESVVNIADNQTSQKKSLEPQQKNANEEIVSRSEDSRIRLTLQPGKWHKSLNIWRRTYLSVDNRRSSKLVPHSVHDNSVEFVAVTTMAGQRKSMLLKPERISELDARPSNVTGSNLCEWRVLQRCGQRKPLAFERLYSAKKLPNSRKIGEGSYGEVYISSEPSKQSSTTVLKVIPIEGQLEINGEVQKTFEQILPEIIISMELCGLGNSSTQIYSTCGFVGIKKVACVKGKYPAHLIKLWDDYNDSKGSENEHPGMFTSSQLYIVLELDFGGKDLDSFLFNNAEQAYYALQQIVFTLAVAEEAFQFEHRDLHCGNILVNNTSVDHLTYKLNGEKVILPTKSVKITIIDYTLSRMTFDDCCLYNDLSCDEELFAATGDYQFDIYRMMRDVLKNNWATFEPRTNIFWIAYIVTKMIDGVSYKNANSKKHNFHINKLTQVKENILNFDSAGQYARYWHKSFTS